VIRQDPLQLREQAARRLLRRLRDLNLGDGTIRLQSGQEVRITGCASLDHPVERGVRYRLSFSNGDTELVEILWRDGRIYTQFCREAEHATERVNSFGLNGHPYGLVELSGLRSAIDLSCASSDEYEALLGLVVEAAIGAP